MWISGALQGCLCRTRERFKDAGLGESATLASENLPKRRSRNAPPHTLWRLKLCKRKLAAGKAGLDAHNYGYRESSYIFHL